MTVSLHVASRGGAHLSRLLWIRPLLIREVPISEGACVMDGTVGETLLSDHPFNQDTACS